MITIMKTSILLSGNGLPTVNHTPRSYGAVKNKLVGSDNTANYWSSTENSATNAWNVNGSNGNVNNNKNNSNVVRAVCALPEKEKDAWVEAYFDCIRHKMSSVECTDYRLLRGVQDALVIAYEAHTFSYKPTVSKCFCVTKPRLREVFAANPRDRVVQHWVCLRLEPLFEARFVSQGNVSFNCRKGFGVLRAVKTLSDKMQQISNNYTEEAWILKIDISGFFMSIDRNLLWERLRAFIVKHYHGYKGYDDKEILLYVVEMIVKHNPQESCIKKGNEKLFELLPDNKTLFNGKPMTGMPIGNLTSQLFANFYMSEFDAWMNEQCKIYGMAFVRFVDDIPIVCKNKQTLLMMLSMIRVFLGEKLHIKLHPDKVYLQPIKHGVSFLGHHIKYDRLYNNRLLLIHCRERLLEADRWCKRIILSLENGKSLSRDKQNWQRYILKYIVSSLNSYMGFMVHTKTYAIRRNFLKSYPFLWKIVYYSKRCQVFKIRRKYDLIPLINVTQNAKKRHLRNRKKVRTASVHAMLHYAYQERDWRKFIKDHNIASRHTNQGWGNQCNHYQRIPS